VIWQMTAIGETRGTWRGFMRMRKMAYYENEERLDVEDIPHLYEENYEYCRQL